VVAILSSWPFYNSSKFRAPSSARRLFAEILLFSGDGTGARPPWPVGNLFWRIIVPDISKLLAEPLLF
jgi:hypothetical protein